MNSTAQFLQTVLKSSVYLKDTKKTLMKAGFDLAYGDTYFIDDIKESINAGNRIIVSMDGRLELLIGLTDDNCLIPFRAVTDSESFECYDDDEFNAMWDGSAIIVSGEQTERDDKTERGSFIIHEPNNDTWNQDGVSDALNQIYCVESLDTCYLPVHPVIVSFREPHTVNPGSNVDYKDYNGFTDGVRITIISKQNPFETFIHELGHIYYDTRLMPMEKRKLTAIWNETEKRKHYEKIQLTGEVNKYKEPKVEMFCDLYTWRLKGETLNHAYCDILKSVCPEGYELIEEIFSRISIENHRDRMIEIEKRGLISNWIQKQDAIDKAYSNNGAKEIPIQGELFKAKTITIANAKLELPECAVPDSSRIHIADLNNNREVVRIADGKLIGKYAVLKADKSIDWEFHNKHKNNIEKIVEKAIKDNNRELSDEQQQILDFSVIEKAGSDLLFDQAQKELEEKLAEIDRQYDQIHNDGSLFFKAKKLLTNLLYH